MEWKLRRRQWTGTTEQLIEDLELAYSNDLKPFCLKLIFLLMYPGLVYVSGHQDIFDMVDIDLFTIVTLNMMVVKLGYTGESEPLFYNYLRPLTSLDEGLYALAYEEDVHGEACIADVAGSGAESSGLSHDESFGVDDLDLSLNEHVNLNVSQNETQLSSMCLRRQMLVELKNSLWQRLALKNLLWQRLALREDAEQCNGQENESTPSINDDDDDEDFLVDEENEIVNPDVNLDIPVKAVQDQLQRELKIHISMSKAFRAKSKAERDIRGDYFLQYSMLRDYYSEDAGINDDDDDEDFLVDEENEIVNPDVDVHLFGISMDLPFDNIGVTNLVPMF
nr:transposase, MuDR, MULE transposase domain protein [Tanacetum cinerariifolium]